MLEGGKEDAGGGGCWESGRKILGILGVKRLGILGVKMLGGAVGGL